VSFAAQGGKFASGIVIPKGHTATLTNMEFLACDALTYGYQLNFGANTNLASKGEGCAEEAEPSVTLGPYPTAQLLRVFLTDNTCSFTYYSDGNHAAVTGSNPFHVAIMDAGGSLCESSPEVPRPPNPEAPGGEAGNLQLTVTVN
jgi:hypothetical protein